MFQASTGTWTVYQKGLTSMKTLWLSTDNRFVVNMMFATFSKEKAPLDEIVINVEIAKGLDLFKLPSYPDNVIPPQDDYAKYELNDGPWMRLVRLFAKHNEWLGGLAAGARIVDAWKNITDCWSTVRKDPTNVRIVDRTLTADEMASAAAEMSESAEKTSESIGGTLGRILANLIPPEYRDLIGEILSGNPAFLDQVIKIVSEKLEGLSGAASVETPPAAGPAEAAAAEDVTETVTPGFPTPSSDAFDGGQDDIDEPEKEDEIPNPAPFDSHQNLVDFINANYPDEAEEHRAARVADLEKKLNEIGKIRVPQDPEQPKPEKFDATCGGQLTPCAEPPKPAEPPKQ